jgi:hypothetical protein
MTNPPTDLEATVERVRAERFPTLSADLVATILKIEAECVENRSDATRRIGVAIQTFLDSKGV